MLWNYIIDCFYGSKIKNYKVITHSIMSLNKEYLNEFNDIILTYIREGWVLFGSSRIVSQSQNINLEIYQTLVKY
jgi:hypothetical protein